MQQSSGTFSTTKCDIENTCVIHQKREIEIMMEWGINIKSQREWGKCLDKALSLVPRFACAPQDNSYRTPCQKSPVPSANTFLFRGFRVRHGPRPILRRALGFLQNSTSLSTSGAYGTGFIDEHFTKWQIRMNYAQHGRSNPQTVLIISSMRNAARSKHTRCNQMVFPSHVFVETCLPKRGRGDAALVCSGLAGVHFWLWGQGANGGREREIEAKSTMESGTEKDAVSRSVETFSGGGKPSAVLQQPAGEREVKEVALCLRLWSHPGWTETNAHGVLLQWLQSATRHLWAGDKTPAKMIHAHT